MLSTVLIYFYFRYYSEADSFSIFHQCFYTLLIDEMYMIYRECIDPFDYPECEAFDVFVNEVLCVGKGTKISFCLFFIEQNPMHG